MFKKFCGAALVGLLITAVANAHFIFVVPSADGKSATVVFSDSLEVDEKIDSAKFASTKLTLRDSSGKETALTTEKLEHALKTKLVGSGNQVIYGTTEYGVLQKGDSKPYLLKYHPKAILGSAFEAPKVGEAVPVEVVPVMAGNKVRFQVLGKGKPLAEIEVTVMVPGKDKGEKVVTDKEGLTPAFEATGRYGVWTRFSENVGGEKDGKKYEQTNSYATLVVDIAKK